MSGNKCQCLSVVQTATSASLPAWQCTKCRRLFVPAKTLTKNLVKLVSKLQQELAAARPSAPTGEDL